MSAPPLEIAENCLPIELRLLLEPASLTSDAPPRSKSTLRVLTNLRLGYLVHHRTARQTQAIVPVGLYEQLNERRVGFITMRVTRDRAHRRSRPG